MSRSDRYIYQAIFCNTGEAVEVRFPDLDGVITFGDSTEDAVRMAQDALEQYLLACENLGIDPPKPSEIGEVVTGKNEIIFLISVWMPILRDKDSNKAVKKTLTIPKWLNDLAVQKEINFSHVLQVGLKNTLGIS
ncbi:MAG: type II toxin-antitoxin system HicB family antitoxin [Clostridiaceae bacterium]